MWKGGEGMLDLDYYCNAVDYIIDSEVCLSHCRNYEVITDDVNHPHLERLINYIKSKDLVPNTINDIRVNSIQVDWNRIRMGKWIISSPSTFAITAGMVSDARIIHSKKWVDARVSENDPFWVGLHRGGNKEYRAEVFI